MIYIKNAQGTEELKIYWKHEFPRTLKDFIKEDYLYSIPKYLKDIVIPYGDNIGWYPKHKGRSTCFILLKVIGDNVIPYFWETYSMGIAYCSLKDTFDKEKGRVVSLRYALDMDPDYLKQHGFTKKEIWDAYFGRKK